MEHGYGEISPKSKPILDKEKGINIYVKYLKSKFLYFNNKLEIICDILTCNIFFHHYSEVNDLDV